MIAWRSTVALATPVIWRTTAESALTDGSAAPAVRIHRSADRTPPQGAAAPPVAAVPLAAGGSAEEDGDPAGCQRRGAGSLGVASGVRAEKVVPNEYVMDEDVVHQRPELVEQPMLQRCLPRQLVAEFR